MSSKINAVIPHHIRSFEELEQLPARLARSTNDVSRALEAYWDAYDTTNYEWRLEIWGRPGESTPREEWQSGRGPRIRFGPARDPGPIWLVFGRKCLFVTTPVKYSFASQDLDVLRSLWDCFASLAKVFDADDVLMYREDGSRTWEWVLDGLSLDEIEQNLRQAGVQTLKDLADLPSAALSQPATWFYWRQPIRPEGLH
jgi:hypothetical protein